jgi:hypothetical protein
MSFRQPNEQSTNEEQTYEQNHQSY